MSGLLVVGVDGSEGATAAVRWGAREAKLREARARAHLRLGESEISAAWDSAMAWVESSEETLKGLEQNAEEIVATALEVAREASPDLESRHERSRVRQRTFC